jgi:hypothetical protein
MRWTGHVACMMRRRMPTGYWWECHKGKDQQEYLDVGRRMILKWMLEK